MLAQWQLGVLLCLASCVIINLGMILQKRSVLFATDGTPLYRQPLWVFGFLVFIIGQLISMWSLGMAPQSMLSSLGSSSLVSNSMLAPALLNEKHSAMSLYSTALLLSGSLLVVGFSSHETQEFTPRELFGLFAQPEFLVLAVGIVVTLASLAVRHHRSGELEAVFFGLLSALLGALSVLFAKCVSILVLGGETGDKEEVPAGAYFSILGMNIIFSVASVYVMNLGIIKYRALDILPVYYSLAVVFQTLTGGVLFQEFLGLDPHQCLALAVGVVLTCLGVNAIASTNDDEASPDQVKQALLPSPPRRTSSMRVSVGRVSGELDVQAVETATPTAAMSSLAAGVRLDYVESGNSFRKRLLRSMSS